ncbi:MAG: hypothetical protein JNJ77_11150 [Planctomycetia bacterium]|nr:hypothetical protein [Planctomycetia bacterium]
MIRKLIYSLGIIALMGALLTPRVEAGLLQMRLTDNLGNSVTVVDNGAGDIQNTTTGLITFSGTLTGGSGASPWLVNVTTGISDPIFPASPGFAKMDLNSVNVSSTTSTGATLLIELTYTGFPAFPSNGILTGNIGGTTNGTLEAWGYKNDSNIAFDTTNPEASVHHGPFSNAAFSSIVNDGHGPINGLYSMTQVVYITHGAGVKSTSFDYELVNAVPVPAGIVLLGMGAPLLGAGYWMRRRRVAVA